MTTSSIVTAPVLASVLVVVSVTVLEPSSATSLLVSVLEPSSFVVVLSASAVVHLSSTLIKLTLWSTYLLSTFFENSPP